MGGKNGGRAPKRKSAEGTSQRRGELRKAQKKGGRRQRLRVQAQRRRDQRGPKRGDGQESSRRESVGERKEQKR